MYDDIKRITVTHGPTIELIVKNPTGYSLVNKGAHGAVFRLSEDKCVKIYAEEINAELEAKSYMAAQHTGLVPRLYESSAKYNIIEYIDGPNLYDYLKHKKVLEIDMTLKLMKAIDMMQNAGFTRLDAALWHFLMTGNGELKLIDVVYAMVRDDPYPVKIITGMKELGLLDDFIKQACIVDEKKCLIWQTALGML